MNRRISGTLYICPDISNPEMRIQYQLNEGDNLIGNSRYCQVILNIPNVAPEQCKIHLSNDASATISTFDSRYSVELSSLSSSSEILKPNVEYVLQPGLVFYLNNEYKCFIEIDEEEVEPGENIQNTAVLEEENSSQREENEINENQVETLVMETETQNDQEPIQNTAMLSEDEGKNGLKALRNRMLNFPPEIGNNVKTQSIENEEKQEEEIFPKQEQKVEYVENESQRTETNKLSAESSPRSSADGENIAQDHEEVQTTVRISQEEDFSILKEMARRILYQNQKTIEISQDDIEIDVKQEKDEKKEEDLNENEDKPDSPGFQRLSDLKEEELEEYRREIDQGGMEVEEEALEFREKGFDSNSQQNVSTQPNKNEKNDNEGNEVITTLVLSETSSEGSVHTPNKNKKSPGKSKENTRTKSKKKKENAEEDLAQFFLKRRKKPSPKQANQHKVDKHNGDKNENKRSKGKEAVVEQQIQSTSKEKAIQIFPGRKVFQIIKAPAPTPVISQATQRKEPEKQSQNDRTNSQKKGSTKEKINAPRGKESPNANRSSFETKEELLKRMENISKGSKKQVKQHIIEENGSKAGATVQDIKQKSRNLEAQIQQICELVDEEEVLLVQKDTKKDIKKADVKKNAASKVIEVNSDESMESEPEGNILVHEKHVTKKNFKKAHPVIVSPVEEDAQKMKKKLAQAEEKPRESLKSTKNNRSIEYEKIEITKTTVVTNPEKNSSMKVLKRILETEKRKKSDETETETDSQKESSVKPFSKKAQPPIISPVEEGNQKAKKKLPRMEEEPIDYWKSTKNNLSAELEKHETRRAAHIAADSAKEISLKDLKRILESEKRETSKSTKNYTIKLDKPEIVKSPVAIDSHKEGLVKHFVKKTPPPIISPVEEDNQKVKKKPAQIEEKPRESVKSMKHNSSVELEKQEIIKSEADSSKESSIKSLQRKLTLPQKIKEIGKRYSPLRVFTGQRIKLSFQGPCKEEFLHYNEIFKRRNNSSSSNNEENMTSKTHKLESAKIESSKERKVRGERKIKQESVSESSETEESEEKPPRSSRPVKNYEKPIHIANLIKKYKVEKKEKMEVETSEESESETESDVPVPKRGRPKKNLEKPSLADFEKLTTVSKKIKFSNDKHEDDELQTKQKSKKQEDTPHFKAIKRNSCQVAFTGFDKDDEEVDEMQEALVKLGAKIIDEKSKNFNVLVMDEFRRTIKFLLALNRGSDIVRYQWAKESVKQGFLLPCEDFAYVDKAAEAKFKFKFAKSLEQARIRGKGFLDGYFVYLPPNIRPSFEELKLLVESADASIFKTKPVKYRDDMLILLNEDDKKNIKWAKELGFQPYSLELIYSAVLSQKLDLDKNKL